MTSTEAYSFLQSQSPIKVGDIVKVLRKCTNYEMGWNTIWVSKMDSMVGKEFSVVEITREGFKLNTKEMIGTDYDYLVPFFSLEFIRAGVPTQADVVLNSEYTAVVSKDKVVVGCQSVPWPKVEEIVKAHDTLVHAAKIEIKPVEPEKATMPQASSTGTKLPTLGVWFKYGGGDRMIVRTLNHQFFAISRSGVAQCQEFDTLENLCKAADYKWL